MKKSIIRFILVAVILFMTVPFCKKKSHQGERFLAMTMKHDIELGLTSCGEAFFNKGMTEERVKVFKAVSMLRVAKFFKECDKKEAIAKCILIHDNKTYTKRSSLTGRPDFDIYYYRGTNAVDFSFFKKNCQNNFANKGYTIQFQELVNN